MSVVTDARKYVGEHFPDVQITDSPLVAPPPYNADFWRERGFSSAEIDQFVKVLTGFLNRPIITDGLSSHEERRLRKTDPNLPPEVKELFSTNKLRVGHLFAVGGVISEVAKYMQNDETLKAAAEDIRQRFIQLPHPQDLPLDEKIEHIQQVSDLCREMLALLTTNSHSAAAA